MPNMPIYATPLEGLKRWFAQQGEKQFRADQVAEWLYRHDITQFDHMTNLSSGLRTRLEADWSVTRLELVRLLKSEIDNTRKMLFRLHDGETIEAVLIPDEGRLTLCISSQVGCKMGCRFCLTAEQKLTRHLKADEIVAQFLEARRLLTEGERISNIVFMGMGEPLDNFEEVKKAIAVLTDEKGIGFGRRKIVVSTVGVAPMMERVVKELGVRLILSLNATNDEIRRSLMPITRKYSIAVLLDSLRKLPLRPKEWVMIAYTLISGVNDSDEEAYRLAELLTGIRCKINLIPYNPFPGSPYERPSEERWRSFHKILLDQGYIVTTRISGGRDIFAACGQLRSETKEQISL